MCGTLFAAAMLFDGIMLLLFAVVELRSAVGLLPMFGGGMVVVEDVEGETSMGSEAGAGVAFTFGDVDDEDGRMGMLVGLGGRGAGDDMR